MAVLPFDPDFRRRAAEPAADRPAVRRPIADRLERGWEERPGAGRPVERPVERREWPAGDLPGADRALVDRPVARRVEREPWPMTDRGGQPVVPRVLVEAPAAAPADRKGEERALARRFFPLVAAVALLDLATKALAVRVLAAGATYGAEWPLRLHLAFNQGAAGGGLWLGEHTRAFNVIATGIAIGLLVMLVPTLAKVDRRSTRAIALVAGGGLGNLASLLMSPGGVPDFLAIPFSTGAWIINGADVALAVGLVLFGRTILTIGRAIRAHGPERAVAALPR